MGLFQGADHVAAAFWQPGEADHSYISLWHFKNDIFLQRVLIGTESKRDTDRLKWRKRKTERDGGGLYHAKCINISIWCLILSPLPLTPLALVALITGHKWALPGQGHVVGVCYEYAT